MTVSSQDPSTSEAPPAPPAPPEVRGTPIRAIDLPGIHDFWAIYDRHYEEIRAIMMVELADDPEVGEIIRNTPREVLDQRSRESRELTRRAIIEGDWQPYLDNLRIQGGIYATGGMSFGAWFRVISAFRPHVVRHLLAAFATESQRLIHAVDGMDHLIDLALSSVGEAYLEAKEGVISRQNEVMGELRTRARYQTILASIADSVVTTDPFGNVVTVNPAFERLMGATADDLLGRRYEEAIPILLDGRPLPWDDSHVARAITARAVVESEEVELRLRRPDGSEIPVSITSAPVVEEGGTVTGGVNVIRERSAG